MEGPKGQKRLKEAKTRLKPGVLTGFRCFSSRKAPFSHFLQKRPSLFDNPAKTVMAGCEPGHVARGSGVHPGMYTGRHVPRVVW